MPILRLPANGWTPRKYQRRLWNYLEGGGTRAVAAWHRRAGKDEICLHWTAVAAHQRPAVYWHMLPEAAQARKAIWDAVNPRTGKRRIDEAFPLELRDSTREHEMAIRFKCGSLWQVVGSDNYNSLVGSPPAGVVFSEWSLAKPAAWAYLRPILAENGGWALFIYTSRGRNHGYTTLETARESGWFNEVLTAEQTGAIPLERLEQERKEYLKDYGPDQGEALFLQEYYCDFHTAVLGAFYGKEFQAADKENRVRKVDHDPKLPVFTAWDLGFSDDTAIWFFQVLAGEVRVIDYYAANTKDVKHYAAVVRAKPYTYGKHWLPHDAVPATLAANGRSILEQLTAEGLKCAIVPDLSVMDGIQAVRQMFPRTYFDSEKCAAGIEALRQYQREWDEDHKRFKDKPRHDWTSHASDAFRYLSLVWKAPSEEKKPEPMKLPQDYTMNDWIKAAEMGEPRRRRI